MKTLGYARVSTAGQDLERQVFKLKEYGIEDNDIYTEKMSGMKSKRPVLQEVMKKLQPGDKIVVESLSRLARSTKDLWNLIQYFLDNDIIFVSLKEQVDLSTATGRLLFTVLSGLVQFERDLTSERTKETLRVKKEEGAILGRPKTINPGQEKRIVELYDSGLIGKEIAKELNIGLATVYRTINKFKAIEEEEIKNDKDLFIVLLRQSIL